LGLRKLFAENAENWADGSRHSFTNTASGYTVVLNYQVTPI
jgi:hypothetical protein